MSTVIQFPELASQGIERSRAHNPSVVVFPNPRRTAVQEFFDRERQFIHSPVPHEPKALEMSVKRIARGFPALFQSIAIRQRVIWVYKWPEPIAGSTRRPRSVCDVSPVQCRENSRTERQWTLRLNVHGWKSGSFRTEIEVIARLRNGTRDTWMFYSLCPQCGKTKAGKSCDPKLYLLSGDTCFRCLKCAELVAPDFKPWEHGTMKGLWSDELIRNHRSRLRKMKSGESEVQ